MEKVVETIFNHTEFNKFSIRIEVVEENFKEIKFLKFKLSYSNDNTGVAITEYNSSIEELLRLSDIPVFAKELVLKKMFIKNIVAKCAKECTITSTFSNPDKKFYKAELSQESFRVEPKIFIPFSDELHLDVNDAELQKIAEDTYYTDIVGYTAHGIDSLDSKEMIDAIKKALIKAIKLNLETTIKGK